ncbi:hypothetical protein HPC49_23095 [Pyxidicoccus fallax]|uniref:Lipoprotein n=1 Tax=Pyxidicoccus fallax TaxID=394095 RepID=A0A848LQS8_9BACT|nr:hypothetical protein [Pyxidicoccus fallax]NMO20247.1 hypothetical protein [Pyxidicoccus fallax]NPC81100.1 hypothetical protein [Pyxidicoccus fallax]
MKRLLLSTATVVSLLGTGCAATSGARDASSGVPLGSAALEPLRLEGADITGPTSSLRLVEDGLHGRFRTRPVSLQWSHQEMTGSVGQLVTRLQLAEGDDTRVWGTFAGLTLDLTEDGTWLHGRVGLCAYALKRDGDTLRGMRDCGTQLERDIEVSFPQALATRPVGERAALMALVLVNTGATDDAPQARYKPKGGTERVLPKTHCRRDSM